MNNFINLKDLSTKTLRKILVDAKKRKNKRKGLNTIDIALKIIKKVCQEYK